MGRGTRLGVVSNEDVEDQKNDCHDREEGDDEDSNEVAEDDACENIRR